MVNSPLIRPAISWGGGGGTLDSHDEWDVDRVQDQQIVGQISSRVPHTSFGPPKGS